MRGRVDQPFEEIVRLCDWANREDDIEALSRKTAGWRENDPPRPFVSLALVDDPKVQRQLAQSCSRQFSAVPDVKQKAGVGRGNGTIRLAYLSPDFRQHPVSILMADILALHDRARFEVTAISYGPDDGSQLRRRIESEVDRFADVQQLSVRATSALIRDLDADIAIDLAGYTTLSRPEILASRPARLQINYLGYLLRAELDG